MDFHGKQKGWRKVLQSFAFAWQGICQTWYSEQNFRIELILSLGVIFFAVIFQISPAEWLIIWLTIAGVLSLELINTAIEAVVDLVTEGAYADLAKIAKDASAAAVFLASMMAVIIGAIIFLPYLWDLAVNWGIL